MKLKSMLVAVIGTLALATRHTGRNLPEVPRSGKLRAGLFPSLGTSRHTNVQGLELNEQ